MSTPPPLRRHIQAHKRLVWQPGYACSKTELRGEQITLNITYLGFQSRRGTIQGIVKQYNAQKVPGLQEIDDHDSAAFRPLQPKLVMQRTKP